MNHPWGIHWFRRDLRIPGNESLRTNWKKMSGKTLGLFCFDSQFLARPDFSHNRFAFFLKTLHELKKDLQDRGGDLLVVDQQPADFYNQLATYLNKNSLPLPQLITWGRDYEPFARQRDQAIERQLSNLKIPVETFRDHLLFEPHEITKNAADSYYQIYSPFARKWFEKLNSQLGFERIQQQAIIQKYFTESSPKKDLFQMSWSSVLNGKNPFRDQLAEFTKKNSQFVTIPIPAAGTRCAYKKLQEFSSKLHDYKEKRDIPSLSGTSQMSLYLKNGSLTTSQIIYHLNLQNISWANQTSSVQYVKELAWREFYYHILFHRPDVEKKSFHPQYENLAWENDESLFELWKNGMTGFPIVDAGMRELKTTGWMHNRVRMIVASFLTKDLLIDWRWGENHFMKELLDGDLAPNNGSWQWAASTGCDPQPYFRVFNPWLQGEKFDPEGYYIKKYIPELSTASAKTLHNPDSDRSLFGYPNPIVDHFIQKEKAIRLYKK